jgi:hypothetical protein
VNNFIPAPDEWWSATIFYKDINRWAFARLDGGIEIFVPAPILYGITADKLAVRVQLSRKPNKRPEAIEAMPLSEYFKPLDGVEPQEQQAT